MKCSKCNTKIDADDLRVAYLNHDSAELRIECECGSTFSAWLDHVAWSDDRGEPVDLNGEGEPQGDKAEQVKLSKEGRNFVATASDGTRGVSGLSPEVAASKAAAIYFGVPVKRIGVGGGRGRINILHVWVNPKKGGRS